MRHTDYCEARTDAAYRRSVNQADCPTCQAWMAGYRVGQHDRTVRDTTPIASAR